MAAQRQRVLSLLAVEPGERVLDVGCGPGYLCCEIAAHTGSRGKVSGVDVSDQMLAIAERRRTQMAPDAPLELLGGDATALPFKAGAFDAVVATQTYEFVVDLPRALAELQWVLRPGGRAVILDTDWDSVVWHSSDQARMERVLDAWRDRVAHPHLPRTLSSQLRHAGFEFARTEVFVIFEPEARTDSYSARQIEHLAAAAGGSLASDDLEAWAEDLRALAAAGNYFFSINRYLFVAVKSKRP